MEQCRPDGLGGDGRVMPWRTQPCPGQPGLGSGSSGVWGCCWAPQARGTVLGCCHQQQKSGRLQTWQGIPGLLEGLQQGVSYSKWDPLGLPEAPGGRHLQLQEQGGTGQQGNGEGTEPRVSSTLGSSGDKPKTLVGSPKLPGTFGSCRVQSKTPWTSWGQQSPGSQGPCWPRRWPGRGGLSLWPAGQPAALGNGAALGPCPTGRGLQPNSLCFGVQMHPPGKDLLHRGSLGLSVSQNKLPKAGPPPAPGHGSPRKSARPRQHPVRRSLSSGWDNGRQGERGKKNLGNFLQVSI